MQEPNTSQSVAPTHNATLAPPGAGSRIGSSPGEGRCGPLDPCEIDELLEQLADVGRACCVQEDALELAQILAGAFQRAGDVVQAARLNSWIEQRTKALAAQDRQQMLALEQ